MTATVIPNLIARLKSSPAAVGVPPDPNNRGQPVPSSQALQVLQRQPDDVRRLVRTQVLGGLAAQVITAEQTPQGWWLHLWESGSRREFRVRSLHLPAAA